MYGHTNDALRRFEHGHHGVIRGSRPAQNGAVPTHGNHGHFPFQPIPPGHETLVIRRWVLVSLANWKFTNGDPRLGHEGECVGEFVNQLSAKGVLLVFDKGPLSIGIQVSVMSHATLKLEGQVVHRLMGQVVLVPEIVAARVQVDAIDRDNLGVIPRSAASPGTDPQANVGIVREMLGELLNDLVAVDGHTDNVAKHHANDNGFFLVESSLGDGGQRLLEVLEKESVWRTQTHDIAPDFRLGHDFPHFFWKPVVMAAAGIFGFALPTVEWSLVQVAHNHARSDVPQRVVMTIVFSAQDIIRRSANVRQPDGIVIFHFVAGRNVAFFATTMVAAVANLHLFVLSACASCCCVR